MKYVQSFVDWKIYSTRKGYRARQGRHWSGLFHSVGEAKQAIMRFKLHAVAQATKERGG